MAGEPHPSDCPCGKRSVKWNAEKGIWQCIPCWYKDHPKEDEEDK